MASATTGFKISCPGCSGQVTIKNPALIGKKVECPKCKQRFVVQEPEVGGAEEAAVTPEKTNPKAAFADAKGKAKDKGKKEKSKPDLGPDGKKKKKSPVKLLVSIAVVGVLALGAAGYFYFFGGEEKPKASPMVARAPVTPKTPPKNDDNEETPAKPTPNATKPAPVDAPMTPAAKATTPPAPAPTGTEKAQEKSAKPEEKAAEKKADAPAEKDKPAEKAPPPAPVQPTPAKAAPPTPVQVAAPTPKPMPEKPAEKPAEKPMTPAVDYAALPVLVLIDRWENPGERDKVMPELIKKMEGSKDDRDTGLKRLKERSMADEGGQRSFRLLEELDKTKNDDLKKDVTKVLTEVRQHYAANPPGLRDDPTNLLPNNSQVVVSIPVRKFTNTLLSNAIFRTRGAFRLDDFKARSGIALSNMERVVLAGNKEHGQSFAVIRTFDPYDREAVREAMQIRAEGRKVIKGKEYYLGRVDFLGEFFGGLIPMDGLRSKAGVHMKDDRTLVYGDVKTIEDFLSSPPQFKQDEVLLPTETTFPGGRPTAPGQPRPPVPMTPGTPPPMQPTPTKAATPPPAAAPKGNTTAPTTTNPGGAAAPRPATPSAPVFTSRTYLTLKPALRQQIERAEKEKESILLFAEDYTRVANSGSKKMLAAYLPFTEPTFPFLNMIAVAWNAENPMTFTAAMACTNEIFASTIIQPRLESKFSDAGRKEWKDAFGFEFKVQGIQQPSARVANRPGMPAMMPGMMPGMFPGNVNPPQRPGGAQPRPPVPGFPGFPMPPGGIRPGGVRPGQQAFRPPQPGQAGQVVEQEKKLSTIDIVRQDEFITVTVTMLEKTDPFVANKIAPEMMYLRGQMDMNSGRIRLRELAGALSGYANEKRLAAPIAAMVRPPSPTRGDRPWPPDERVSWMRELLPYMGDARLNELYGGINTELSWRDPANVNIGRVLVPQFLHPESRLYYTTSRRVDGQLAVTHFVGMAGVGPDAASYPKEDKRAGIFGYDRQTKLEDVKDGLANTIYMIQTDPSSAGPWIAGGGSTVRGTSEDGKDVGTPGGFLSPAYSGKAGAWVIMADGSARFLSKGVSPQVFKDLCTMAGSDEGSFQLHEWAPKATEYSAPPVKGPTAKAE